MFKEIIFFMAALLISALPPAAARAEAGKTYVLNAHALPLGDGRVADGPERGAVYACRTRFRQRGARHAGDWIHGDTWDDTQKLHVRGSVDWPEARFSVTLSGNDRIISGNGLPVGAETGVFPIEESDPAYAIDRNPNTIRPQQIHLVLPLHPAMADTPSCVPMGMIGVMTNGVALFNALDAAGRDAAAHEVQDTCNGHPERDGTYHYHGPSPCVSGWDKDNQVIGYALDGFPITGMFDAHGRELTDKDLDACHGRTSPVMMNGKAVTMYHYVMTRDYPYSVGCFRGTPVFVPRARQNEGMRRGFRPGPPPFGGRMRRGP